MARTIRTSKGEHFKGGSPDLAPVDTEDVLLRGSPAIQNRVVVSTIPLAPAPEPRLARNRLAQPCRSTFGYRTRPVDSIQYRG